jgi:hypothetical protein
LLADFRLTLFFSRIAFNVVMNKGCSPYWIAAVSLLLAFVLHVVNFKQPFYLANTMTGVFFMSIGYLYAKRAKITPPHFARLPIGISDVSVVPIFRGYEK